MFKKFFKFYIIFIALFFVNFNALAYEYYDAENEDEVLDMINEIYTAKQQYIDLVGGYEEDELIINNATSTSYWWPIGSVDTIKSNNIEYAAGTPESVLITSNWGYRDDPFGRGKTFHNGLDISGGRGLGQVNIIAAKDGIVVYPTANVSNNCPSENSLSNCGGGYGNYVIIQHSDGNYTLYGHLYENSITVTAGDKVVQGQVIGKMGSSGNSTGAHLHFEVRIGNNASSTTDDPLNYISAENSRKVMTGGEILKFLHSWEGSTPIIDDSYKVVNIGDGVRTVGSGVTLENNIERFKKYGLDITNYPTGSTIPISIVDQIEMEIIEDKRIYIENVLSNNSISLEEVQIEALISMMYNCGNINGFVDNYKLYGNTNEFYKNWFFRNIRKGSKFERGLTRRRNAEWSLFHEGIYVYNS